MQAMLLEEGLLSNDLQAGVLLGAPVFCRCCFSMKMLRPNEMQAVLLEEKLC